jgi:segregation and condensation protein B
MELASIIEALVTASDEALSSEDLARLIRSRVAEAEDARAAAIENDESPAELPEWLLSFAEVTPQEVIVAIAKLNADYEATGRAFNLTERAKGWRIFTRAEYGDFVKQLFPGRRPERLSAPAMETLAIIAYRQPITKSAIEAVRGVSCDGMLQKLLDRELVRIGGRAELPGRPLLYETTEVFYEHFGIRSIDDLPNSGELRRVKLPEPKEESESPSAEEQLALAAVGSDSSQTEVSEESAAGPAEPEAKSSPEPSES